jgi:hypothetical protein
MVLLRYEKEIVMGTKIGVTVEIPDGVDRPIEYAGRMAITVGEALLRVGPVDVIVARTEAVAVGMSASPYEGDDGATNLRKLMGEIAPNTRKALHVIAAANLAGGPIHAIDLREGLGFTSPSQVAGVLTSLGFAENRTGLPKPYTQDWAQKNGVWGNAYTMTSEVAQAIVEMVDETGAFRKTA